MTDYMVLKDSKKRARLVSREDKQYQFCEKENKPNAMKCRFKTNKTLTAAVKETDHTTTTSKGKVIHEKLASKPIEFQLSRKSEEQRMPTSRSGRCEIFSQGEYCQTHKRIFGLSNNPDDAGCS